MKKILLLDTNFSAKPIYDFLVSIGAEVYVVGGRPDDVLAKSVENYVNLDYSDVDKVKKIVDRLAIDYIVPGGNDLSYKVCSAVNSEYNFNNIDSVETTEIINDKRKFREAAININLHVPKIIELDNIAEHLPVIIKPTDSYSGHGITVISDLDKNKIKSAINNAIKFSRSQSYIIEEFVQGQLYSYSAFIANGNIIDDFIVAEYCIANKYVVDTSYVVSNFNPEVLEQIRNDIISFAEMHNLVDGLMHAQFVYDGRDFWLIELTRRCPGDLYSNLIDYSTGFQYTEYYVSPFLNRKIVKSGYKSKNTFVIRHTITSEKDIYFHSISFNEKINVIDYIPLSISGDKVRKSPCSRIGILFLVSDFISEHNNLLNSLINRSLYDII